MGGLCDLIGKLTAGGVAPQVNSWVGPGANQPIQPGQLGGAGPEHAQRTVPAHRHEPAGIVEPARDVLPQLINHLTPNGRMPTLADLEK